MPCRWSLPVLILAVLGTRLDAAESAWDERMAYRFSPRLTEVGKELAAIDTEVPTLPGVPVADQGGTGGFSRTYRKAEPGQGEEFSVTLRLQSPGAVDLVVLVPARRYGVGGLEPQFGLPDAFTVDLLDESGKALARIADEHGVWADPVRAGHPFVLPVAPGVRAAAVKISAGRLRVDASATDPEGLESFPHAWAEAFVFEGERNLAVGAHVGSPSGDPSSAPWQWADAYLVDGQTTLGLPEIAAGPHQNVGWMSDAFSKASDTVWLEFDLGEVREFDALRLFPAKKATPDLPSGFGFPRRFTVSVFNRQGTEPGEAPSFNKEFAIANPGHNPVLVSLGPCRGRNVKINITQLWKAYENFEAFAALSEVEVLNGEKNLAEGARVSTEVGSSAIIGPESQYWNAVSLTDGFGPDGKIVPARTWLLALDHRLQLEEKRYQLRQEAAAIVEGWRRAGWWTVILFGGLGTVLVVALPIRYQLRSKRQLAEVRNRIAGDLHDEVGSNLGSIQMYADLAERHSAPADQLKRIQRIAAETVSAVRDIVWLLRPQGDHRIATVEHMRETCSIMLESHEWKFTANEAAWQCEMPDDTNRHLFLYLREALHNILRHAAAQRVELHVECDPKEFRLRITDDGGGIAPERLEKPATLRALRKRAEALDAAFAVKSSPGEGTSLELVVPLQAKRRAKK